MLALRNTAAKIEFADVDSRKSFSCLPPVNRMTRASARVILGFHRSVRRERQDDMKAIILADKKYKEELTGDALRMLKALFLDQNVFPGYGVSAEDISVDFVRDGMDRDYYHQFDGKTCYLSSCFLHCQLHGIDG